MNLVMVYKFNFNKLHPCLVFENSYSISQTFASLSLDLGTTQPMEMHHSCRKSLPVRGAFSQCRKKSAAVHKEKKKKNSYWQ